MNRLLMCIPTRNRSEMVKEVIEYEWQYYHKYPIDICYYDSSDDAMTKNVVEECREKYGLSLLWEPLPDWMCLDYKLIEILKQVQQKEYEYIWLINDSISITEPALELVYELLEQNYDMIRLPLAGEGSKEDIICTDANDWFQKCSAGMAHMASTIMKTSLLKEAECDWEKLKKKYVGGNELDENHGYFFMVAFYLEQILKLKNFSGIFIGNRVKWRRDSPLKGQQIYWRTYIFQTWAKSYVETILQLPDIYTEKTRVIRESDNITPGRFSIPMLVNYRMEGQYDINVYKKYKEYFPYITNVPLYQCYLFAVLPKCILKNVLKNETIDESKWCECLHRIMEKIGSNKVIIYGAGLYGEKVVKELLAKGKKGLIECVAVTDDTKNITLIEGIPVRKIDELVSLRKEAYVIIATLPESALRIEKVLKRKGFRKYASLFRT